MAMNSVVTNSGAMVALQSLNRTNDALSITQKRISTGLRVADAKDDGAAFAVAQTVRSDMAGLTSANEQMGGVKGVLDTTLAALGKVSDTMKEIEGVLVKLADTGTLGETRAQYNTQYQALVGQVNNFLADAKYNGKALAVAGVPAATDSISTVRNEVATTYTVAAVSTDGLTMGATPTAPADAAAAQTLLTGTAANDFKTVRNNINTALNNYGSDSRYLDAQISFNKDRLDAMEGGLGALLDADLAKESAKLQALQIRQQLGTQSLSIANQAPQTLLSLFR